MDDERYYIRVTTKLFRKYELGRGRWKLSLYFVWTTYATDVSNCQRTKSTSVLKSTGK